MPNHNCSTLVATCMDFRLQKCLESWLQKQIGVHEYDRVSWAGGVFDAFGILKQIDISVRLHHIERVVLVNHEDCGAYGPSGTLERHSLDLKDARRKIHVLFPELDVNLLYLHLDGSFKEIK